MSEYQRKLLHEVDSNYSRANHEKVNTLKQYFKDHYETIKNNVGIGTKQEAIDKLVIGSDDYFQKLYPGCNFNLSDIISNKVSFQKIQKVVDKKFNDLEANIPKTSRFEYRDTPIVRKRNTSSINLESSLGYTLEKSKIMKINMQNGNATERKISQKLSTERQESQMGRSHSLPRANRMINQNILGKSFKRTKYHYENGTKKATLFADLFDPKYHNYLMKSLNTKLL